MLIFFKRQKGFTLVEAIVIAVIIGILASISIPLYKGYIAQQNKKLVNGIAESVAAAANGYFRQYNKNPTKENLELFLADQDRFSIIIFNDGKLLVIDSITNVESDSISFR